MYEFRARQLSSVTMISPERSRSVGGLYLGAMYFPGSKEASLRTYTPRGGCRWPVDLNLFGEQEQAAAK